MQYKNICLLIYYCVLRLSFLQVLCVRVCVCVWNTGSHRFVCGSISSVFYISTGAWPQNCFFVSYPFVPGTRYSALQYSLYAPVCIRSSNIILHSDMICFDYCKLRNDMNRCVLLSKIKRKLTASAINWTDKTANSHWKGFVFSPLLIFGSIFIDKLCKLCALTLCWFDADSLFFQPPPPNLSPFCNWSLLCSLYYMYIYCLTVCWLNFRLSFCWECDVYRVGW